MNSSLISLLNQSLFRNMLFSLHVFVCFTGYFFMFILSFITLCSEKMLDIISIFLNLLKICLNLLKSTHRLSDSEAQLQPWHASYWAGVDHTKLNLPKQGLVPAQISPWVCCLQSLLNHTLMLSEVCHCMSWFWAPWEGLWCSLISGNACVWHWPTWLELQGIEFMAASAGSV